MRNKKYLSLRVKLLKRQFGIPNDLMSLKSMSISSPNPRRDVNENSRPGPPPPMAVQADQGIGSSAVERSAYNGNLIYLNPDIHLQLLAVKSR